MPDYSTTMVYCDNWNCETPDKSIEKISDYKILDGEIVCNGCYEMMLDHQEESKYI